MTARPPIPTNAQRDAVAPAHRSLSVNRCGALLLLFLAASACADGAHAQSASAASLPAAAVAVTSPAVSSAPRGKVAVAPVVREEGVRWQSLTPAQRDALAPLEREWPGIDTARKQKWLAIAGRFHALPAPEQARISQRMTEWARLSPTERGELRMRFQETRQVPAPDRSARWEAYQKLPPDQKKQFAARAAASSAPAGASGAKPGVSRDVSQGSQAKVNTVPNPALASPSRAVAPTVVQASPGATTRLITRLATPPAHQQTGMPKIAATPEFVNRSTLLPRRGPQAAAVTPPGVILPMTVGAPIVRAAPGPLLPASTAASNPSR